MSEPSDKVIEYAPRQKFHLSRRAKHVTLIVVALVIGAILAPRLYRQLYWQWLVGEFTTYQFKGDLPAMEVLAANQTLTYSTKVLPAIPARFNAVMPLQGQWTLFMGQLADRSGRKWLVRIDLEKGWERYTPVASSRQRNDGGSAPVVSRGAYIPDFRWSGLTATMRFLPAQRDAADPSHITIRVNIKDADRVTEGYYLFDGYLNDDGTMTLELRESPTTTPG